MGGFGNYDIGDESMLEFDLPGFRKLAPNANFLVLSRNPAYTAKYHGIDTDVYLENFFGPQNFIERVCWKINTKLGFIYKLLRLSFNAFLLRFIHRTIFLNSKERKYLMNLSSADLIFTDGGGTLSDRTGRFYTLASQLLTYLLASILRKPIFLSGQTIGPFKDRLFPNYLTRICLNRVDVITLRDHHYSKNMLSKLGVNKPSIYLSTDDAFSLPASPVERIQQIFKEEGINVQKDKVLIGVNVPDYADAKDTEFRKMFASFVDFLISDRSAQIIFVPMDYHRPGSDAEAMSEVYAYMTHKRGVHILHEKHNAKELKGIIGQLDFGVGARYHFNVYAATMGVPSIALASNFFTEIRHEGIMGMLGVKNNILKIRNLTLDELISKFDGIYNNREQFKEKIKDPIKKYEMFTMNHLKLAVELMGKDVDLQPTEEEIKKDIASLNSSEREAMIMDYAHELEKAPLNFDTVYTPEIKSRFEYLKVLLKEWEKSQQIDEPNIVWAKQMLNNFIGIERHVKRCKEFKTQYSFEEVLNIIKTRRSTRCWSNREIPEEILRDLIVAGMWAPSYGNRQACRYYVVRDEIKKEKLAFMRERFFFKAKVLILVGVDKRLYSDLEIKYAPFIDGGVAMQNILLAAHVAGLGACPAQLTPQEIDSSSFKKDNYQNVKLHLNIPEHFMPVGIIGLGYPEKIPCPPPRKNVEEVALFE